MTRKRDKAPAPIVRLTGGRLSPVSAWDAELLSDHPPGTEFDLAARTKRSKPHNGMYWAQLSQIIKATGAYPTPEHLHIWIKHRLGYTEAICDPSGKVVAVNVDSTAFAAMDQAAFMRFYEQAAQLVAAEMGIDMGAMK